MENHLDIKDFHEAKIHELKILPQYFELVLNGVKTFEIRKDDRGFKVGDYLMLREYKAENRDLTGPKIVINKGGYTGRHVQRKITYIFKGGIPYMGLRKGYVILALS